MKSLRSRLEALEQAARVVSGSRQLEILFAAIGGDPAAIADLEQVRSRGALAGRLGELYDALTCPLESDQSTQ